MSRLGSFLWPTSFTICILGTEARNNDSSPKDRYQVTHPAPPTRAAVQVLSNATLCRSWAGRGCGEGVSRWPRCLTPCVGADLAFRRPITCTHAHPHSHSLSGAYTWSKHMPASTTQHLRTRARGGEVLRNTCSLVTSTSAACCCCVRVLDGRTDGCVCHAMPCHAMRIRASI